MFSLGVAANTDGARLADPPLASCSEAWFLTGCEPVPVHSPGTGDFHLEDIGSCQRWGQSECTEIAFWENGWARFHPAPQKPASRWSPIVCVACLTPLAAAGSSSASRRWGECRTGRGGVLRWPCVQVHLSSAGPGARDAQM